MKNDVARPGLVLAILLAVRWPALALAILSALPRPALAETPLYETGPGQDIAFVRFLNATEGEATIVSARGSAKVVLGAQRGIRASKFYPVTAGTRLSATIRIGARSLPAVVVAKPGEYVTVAAIEDASGALGVRLLRETPADYHAARSSVALSNADASCTRAAMSGGARTTQVVAGIAPFAIGRRLVNPVKLVAQVHCDGRPAGAPVDLAQLEAGERYSVFLVRNRGGQEAFFVRDDVFAARAQP